MSRRQEADVVGIPTERMAAEQPGYEVDAICISAEQMRPEQRVWEKDLFGTPTGSSRRAWWPTVL